MHSRDSAGCVPDLLRTRAVAEPDAVALLVDGARGLTFRRWDERSNAAARGVMEGGLRRGDRVVLYFDNTRWDDYAVCYMAVLKAGGVAVPLSSRFTASELARVVEHCEPRVVVCDPALVPEIDASWLAHPAQLEEGRSCEPVPAIAGGDDLSEILYTSGTTGMPKGVACSHRSILSFDLPDDPDLRTGARSILHAFPIGTNAGQECLRVPLRRGGLTAIVLSAPDPELLCSTVATHRVRRLQLVPATAHVVVASGAPGRHDLSSVERVTLSSAPTPPTLVPRLNAAFPNASVWIAYALTESGGARTLARCDEDWQGSVGRPVGASEVRIADDAGVPLTAGEAGEVWLRKGAPARQYFHDPDATAAAFVDGWLRTGDIGYLDDEGQLYLVDRKKDLIISGGSNVSSVEVENALYEHPAVEEAAVFGVPHDVLGQDVAAAVVVGAAVDPRELRGHVRARLGEHKVPHHIEFVDRLPRNDVGKVLKRELRERFAPPVVAVDAVAPVTDTQRAVAGIWAEVLGSAAVGVHDDFFELGGHSLAATQIVARVRDALAVTLPVTAVFEWPTVTELAAAVDERRNAGP